MFVIFIIYSAFVRLSNYLGNNISKLNFKKHYIFSHIYFNLYFNILVLKNCVLVFLLASALDGLRLRIVK